MKYIKKTQIKAEPAVRSRSSGPPNSSRTIEAPKIPAEPVVDNTLFFRKMSKNKKKSVKELNAELELLAERVKKLEEKDASEDPVKVQEKLNGIEEILKSYDKKIGDLDRELLQARHDNNIEKGKDSKMIDGEVCNKTVTEKRNLNYLLYRELIQARKDPDYSTDGEVCDKTLKDKPNLKEHINPRNPKTYECENCDETFTDCWKMKEHLELHGNE